MGLRILLPKYRIKVDDATIFLAGPISCAPKWQDKAIEIISAKDPRIYIASPSKDLREEYLSNSMRSDSEYLHQLDWKRHYLEQASRRGAIMFWLPPAEQQSNGRAYARDTRGELGEWRGRMKYDSLIKLAVGGEDGFDGLDVIQRNFLAVRSDMRFCSTLEQTCMEAIRLARP